MSTEETTHAIADRLAVEDVIVRYFELVDSKGWDQMDEVFTEDTTASWVAGSVIEGWEAVAGAMRHMSGSDEILTFHHVSSMTPHVEGDSATVSPRVQAMHVGLGPRDGLFYESLAVQPTLLVRTPEGWRIKHHDWRISYKHGDLEALFAPEIAAGRQH
jgi:hypothetical protein